MDEYGYAIYWQPSNWSQSFASGYSTLLNRYFGDVAADSGQTSNVYDAATQYSGIQYSSSFAGSVTATDQIGGAAPRVARRVQPRCTRRPRSQP